MPVCVCVCAAVLFLCGGGGENFRDAEEVAARAVESLVIQRSMAGGVEDHELLQAQADPALVITPCRAPSISPTDRTER